MFSILGRTALAVTTSAICLTVAAPAAHASASTPEGYLTAGIGAIRELDEADSDLAKAAKSNDTADWEAARRHVSNYYYKFYDPKLEGPSRGLTPVDGRPRKPQMEGFKGDAIRSIRLCVDKDPKCDNKVNVADVDRLRVNVARDVLILAGLVGDSTPEPDKIAAAKMFITAIQSATAKNEPVSDPVSFAKNAIKNEKKVASGKVVKDNDPLPAVEQGLGLDPDAQQPQGELPKKHQGDNASSSDLALPAIIVAVVAAIIGAVAAFGRFPGLTLPR